MPPFKFRLPPFSGDNGLTPQQRRAALIDKAIFTGVPGSGKTTVAIWRILQKKDDLLLTYTRLLSAAISHLTNNSKDHDGVKEGHSRSILGADQWYYSVTNKSFLSADLENNQVLQKLNSNNVRLGKVVVDEGQDLHDQFYRALKQISRSVTVGYDVAQQVFDDVDFDENSLKTILGDNESTPLSQNFRNLFDIYNFARNFITNDPRANDPNMLQRLEKERPGGDVYVYELDDDKTQETIYRILSEQGNGNVGILLSSIDRVDHYSEILEKKGKEHSKYHSRIYWKEKRDIESNLKNILVTTFKSAKGLEFDTVIMPDFEDAENEHRKQYYVGVTRARRGVYIICSSLPDMLRSFPISSYKTNKNTGNTSTGFF
jgi:DNA helicase IV